MRSPTVLVLLFAACGGDAPAPGPPPPRQAADTGVVARATETRDQVAAKPEVDTDDPWRRLVEASGSGAAKAELALIATDRQMARAVDAAVAERALVEVERALAGGCRGEAASAAFAGYQVAAGDYLANDRDALGDLLEAAGVPGRQAMLAGPLVAAVVPPSRAALARINAGTIELWEEGVDDPGLEARRLAFELGIVVERAGIDARTALLELEADLGALDSTDPDVDEKVIDRLGHVDDLLLAGQRARFEKLVEVCPTVDRERWLVLLAQGKIADFIGAVGEEEPVEAAPTAGRPEPVRGKAGVGPRGGGRAAPEGARRQGGRPADPAQGAAPAGR